MKHSFAPFGREEAAFLSAATGIDFTGTDFRKPDWLCVSARDERGKLMGLCCFEFKTWFDAHFTLAIRDQRCVTRRVMAAMFQTVFRQARRVSALIDVHNVTALRQARLMGFQDEGYMRLGVEGTHDALLLGMLIEDCRYLRRAAPQRRVRNGLVSEAA
jgi:hypothetical protein